MNRYTIELNEDQVHILVQALDIWARLKAGHLDPVLRELPLQDRIPVWDLVKDVSRVVQEHGGMVGGVDGIHSNLGVSSSELDLQAKEAWSICEVLRYQLHNDSEYRDNLSTWSNTPINWHGGEMPKISKRVDKQI